VKIDDLKAAAERVERGELARVDTLLVARAALALVQQIRWHLEQDAEERAAYDKHGGVYIGRHMVAVARIVDALGQGRK